MDAIDARVLRGLLVAVLGGCLGGSGTLQGADVAAVPGDGAPEGSIEVEGIVVDPELVPIPEVTVAVSELELVVTTYVDGMFQVRLPHAGEFQFVFEKRGYATADVKVRVEEESNPRVLVTLQPVALDVPYHETAVFATYAQCWLSAGPAGVPCLGFIDYLTGVNVSQDKPTYLFRVENPGLANLLIEIAFKPQSFGKDAIIVMREPGSIFSGAQKSWLLRSGASPIRTWLEPGKVGDGGREKFEEPAGTRYMAVIGGWGSNNTAPSVALHLDFRTQDYFTFFYNRPGPPEFTILPDQ